jgi:tripartite-type tricarboxylate transporter receptor subunit TctC
VVARAEAGGARKLDLKAAGVSRRLVLSWAHEAGVGVPRLCLLGNARLGAVPTRPVTIIVPIPPGGAPDIAARVLADKLGQTLGQPVVVENRAGAERQHRERAGREGAADGYTLGLLADSQIAINPHLYKMPIDTLRELAPVSPVAVNQFVLTVNPSLPVKTFPEFIEYARKANPPLPYASGGNGSQHHLTMEMLKQRAGIKLLHVPYKGGAPAAAATVAGDTVAMWSGSSNAPQIRAGRLRPLAVSGAQRSPQYPDLPTISEFYPGFENSIWLGLFGPAGIPEPRPQPPQDGSGPGARIARRQAKAQRRRRPRSVHRATRRSSPR